MSCRRGNRFTTKGNLKVLHSFSKENWIHVPFEWPFEQKLAPQSQCPNAQVRKKRISLLLLTLNVIFTSSCKLFNDTNFTQVNKKKKRYFTSNHAGSFRSSFSRLAVLDYPAIFPSAVNAQESKTREYSQ